MNSKKLWKVGFWASVIAIILLSVSLVWNIVMFSKNGMDGAIREQLIRDVIAIGLMFVGTRVFKGKIQE